MNSDPCKKCGLSDRYIKGKFSYCRPCHNEAQKRYAHNKRMGISVETKKPPKRSIEYMLSLGNRGRLKLSCSKGHPYSGDNVRVEQQHGRLLRRCRACERNAKRVRYGLAPELAPSRLSDMLDS
jgi:hypothetical protein